MIFKRDGREQDFDGTKIENAVLKAFIEKDGKTLIHSRFWTWWQKSHSISAREEGK